MSDRGRWIWAALGIAGGVAAYALWERSKAGRGQVQVQRVGFTPVQGPATPAIGSGQVTQPVQPSSPPTYVYPPPPPPPTVTPPPSTPPRDYVQEDSYDSGGYDSGAWDGEGQPIEVNLCQVDWRQVSQESGKWGGLLGTIVGFINPVLGAVVAGGSRLISTVSGAISDLVGPPKPQPIVGEDNASLPGYTDWLATEKGYAPLPNYSGDSSVTYTDLLPSDPGSPVFSIGNTIGSIWPGDSGSSSDYSWDSGSYGTDFSVGNTIGSDWSWDSGSSSSDWSWDSGSSSDYSWDFGSSDYSFV